MEMEMNKKNIETFLEENNMDYLYLLLSNLEVHRLSNLPFTIRQNLGKKITEMALEHVAANEIPDYIFSEPQEELEEPIISEQPQE